MDLTPFLAASATVTKAVDFTRNAVDPRDVVPKWVWNLLSFAYGILIAFLSSISIIPGQRLDILITGLAIGASASGFHEVFAFFSAKSKVGGR